MPPTNITFDKIGDIESKQKKDGTKYSCFYCWVGEKKYYCGKTELHSKLKPHEPFILDIEPSKFESGAPVIMGFALPTPQPAPGAPQSFFSGIDEVKYRSMCFSYAKDLRMAQIQAGVAKTIDLPELLIASELVFRWYKGDYKVDEGAVVEATVKANKPKETKGGSPESK